jgi:hypothetical protein
MWITIISNGLQFLLLGILVQIGNTHTELRQKHKGKYLSGFFLCSLLIFGLASLGAYKQGEQAEELKKAVTGGDSYPVIIPQPGNWNLQPVSLVVTNFGDAALSGVTAEFSCLLPIAPQKELIGTLPAHAVTRISSALNLNQCRDSPPYGSTLVIKGERVADYWIDMSAQNGTYHELLQFKRGDNCHAWSYRYSVWTTQGVGTTANKKLGVVGDVKELYRVPQPPQDWFGDEECQ